MTELVSAETAREMLDWWEPGELAGRQAEVARDYGTIYAAAPELAETVIAQAEQMKMVRDYLQGMTDTARKQRRYGLEGDLQQAVDELSADMEEQ